MTNHVHLLCTPQEERAISRMMQSIGRMYVRYYNHTYQRSETLWEGRFKSSLVQSERYLLELHRYIELNPIILAGNANGTFTTGRHVRYTSNEKIGSLFISMLQASGVDVTTFGDSMTPLSGL